MIKLSVNETKCSSLLARTRALTLFISISIFDFGPEKLTGLSRNGPQTRETAEIEPKSYVITQSLGVNRIMELREQKFLSRAKNIIAKLKTNFEKTWQFRNARWMFKLAAFRGKWNF